MEKLNTIQEFVEVFNSDTYISVWINDVSVICDHIEADNIMLEFYSTKGYSGSILNRELHSLATARYKWVAD